MATPALRASAGTVTTSATSSAVTIPTTGTGGTVAVGDLMLFSVTVADTSGRTYTDPSGWTIFGSPIPIDNASITFQTRWYYRFVQSGDPGATVTITTGGAATAWVSSITVWSGVDPAWTPTGNFSIVNETVAGTTHSMPTFTPTAGVACVIVEYVADKGTSPSSSFTAPVTQNAPTRIIQENGSGTAKVSHAVGFWTQSTAGATTTDTWTGTASTATAHMGAIALSSPGGTSGSAAGAFTWAGTATSAAANASATGAFTFTGTATAAVPASVKQTAWEPKPSGAEFVTRVNGGTAVRLKVAISYLGTPVYSGSQQAPDTDGYVRDTATGLTVGTRYFYWYTDQPSGGSESPINVAGGATSGRCNTLPATGAVGFKVAFGGCVTNLNTDGTALADVETWAPDFWMHLGDFHYNDPTSTSYSVHVADYEAQAAGAGSGHYVSLLRDWGVFYNPSDHDFGPSDNGPSDVADFPGATAASKSIQVVFPTGTLVDSRTPKLGLYRTWVVGRVRFIQVDVRNQDRTDVSVTGTGTDTMLGATQLTWLKAQLVQPEPFKVIVCDTAWMGADDNTGGLPVKGDWWPAYPTERNNLITYLGANSCGHVELWHSDSHLVGYATAAKNTWGGFPVLCAAPFANIGGGRDTSTFSAFYGNSGGDCRQYGRVTFTDDGTTITRVFQGWDAVNSLAQVSDTVTVVSATATGSFTLTGTATGRAAATAAGAFALTGTANASAVDTAAGSFAMTGTATAKANTTAAGSATLTGTATATAAATANGSITWTGTATPAAPVSAAGSITFTGLASTQGAPANAAGGFTLTGTAAASATATSAGTITVSGSATAAARAAVAGSFTWAGTSTGSSGGSSTASGSITFTGTAAAMVNVSAAGAVTFTGSASARASVTAAGVFTVTGSATAHTPTTGRDITITVVLDPDRFTSVLDGDRFTSHLGADVARTILLSAGAVEYVTATVTEATGQDITSAPLAVSLGNHTEPGTWQAPDLTAHPTPSTADVSMLVGGSGVAPAPGRWYLWTRVTDDPEIVPVRAPEGITIA